MKMKNQKARQISFQTKGETKPQKIDVNER
jgi:hypothetical protein